jgi:hypothetical protein
MLPCTREGNEAAARERAAEFYQQLLRKSRILLSLISLLRSVQRRGRHPPPPTHTSPSSRRLCVCVFVAEYRMQRVCNYKSVHTLNLTLSNYYSKLHQILNIPLAIEVAVQPREEDGSAP